MASRWLMAALLVSACSGELGGGPPAPRGEGDAPASKDASAQDARVDASTPPSDTADDGGVPQSYGALAPRVYVGKVKSLLTALPPTREEVEKVEADPSALKGLIAEWQKTPQYSQRMIEFFTMAFQQGDVTAELVLAANVFQQGPLDPRVIQNMRESFARTALQLVQEGRPFTEVLTTRRFMLTPALMLAMAWLDERASGDGGGVSDLLHEELGDNAKYIMQGDTKIDIAESTNPSSPNFFKFYSAQVAAASGDCKKPLTIDHENRITLYTMTMGETLMNFFLGREFGLGFCRYGARETVLGKADFESWRMVNIRQPKAGEKPTWVYQIPLFRGGSELVFRRPYVGFYTTPSFLYTWQTNSSNQARVTINQTVVVALGQKFDGSHRAKPTNTATIDSAHATPGTACYQCHQAMDPMRQFFRSNYTLYWSVQADKKLSAVPGEFVLGDRSEPGSDIASLGKLLASDPRFASAWVGKLCIWADGAVCDPSGDSARPASDPELLRIAERFVSSGFDWNVLVQELLSSPLVTYAEPTATTMARGNTFSIAKKAHLCQRWDSRLGLDDVCGQRALPTTSSGDPIKTIASVLPSDSYSRGQTTPTLANDPGMFFFAGVENACATLVERVVDKDGAPYQSSDVAGSLTHMVHTLMGIPAPDDAEPLRILQEHFDAARKGASVSEALGSTFMLACLSPSTVSVGQ